MSFLTRALYQLLITFLTLSFFPVVVAVVAPLAALARVVSFFYHELFQGAGGAGIKMPTKQQRQKSNDASASSSLENSTPNHNHAVVILNAGSSFEAEGLVRYFATRGCTVIACDRNTAVLNDLFRHDQQRVRCVGVLSPDHAVAVRKALQSSGKLLFAVIIVEPSGEVVMRRVMAREAVLGNNLRRDAQPGTVIDTIRRLATFISDASAPAQTSSAFPFGGGSSSKHHHNRTESNSSSAASTSSNQPAASPATTAASSTSNSLSNTSFNSSTGSITNSFDQILAQSFSNEIMEAAVQTPVKTYAAVLREVLPLAVSFTSAASFAADTASTGAAVAASSSSGNTNIDKRPFKPRVIVISRPDEPEVLSTALAYAHYGGTSITFPTIPAVLHGISALRQGTTRSLLDACRRQHAVSMDSTESAASAAWWGPLRVQHIELFATAAMRQSRSRWLHHAADFAHAAEDHANNHLSATMNSALWRVPAVLFGANTEIRAASAFGSPSPQRDSSNSSAAAAASGNDNSNSVNTTPDAAEDIVRRLGNMACAVNPNAGTQYAPSLQLFEPASAPSSSGGSSSLTTAAATSNNNNTFVGLTWWNNVGWMLREERFVDVMSTAFHSSTALEGVVRRFFGWVCS